MDIGFQKTIVFLIFIGIGVLLKVKFKSKEEITGIKKIILNLALPATIFVALLGIDVELSLLLLPILALTLNLLLFVATPLLLPVLGIKKESPEYRTARLLVPSLAPGLSCFPFVLEFLGEDFLAKAAMADLGNKLFVLIFLYFIAMNWHYGLQSNNAKTSKGKVKTMLKAMISEPVNLFIGVALLMLAFGFSKDSLPFFLSQTLEKLSLIMTPLVLLFIGLAVKIKRKQFLQILSLLCVRAGLVLFISTVFITVSGIDTSSNVLLMLAFGLSACSFWPYAHIATVDSLEMEIKPKKKTFNSNFGIAILALSFPISTVLVLTVLNSGQFLLSGYNLFMCSGFLLAIGLLIPRLIGVGKKLGEHKSVNPKLKSAKYFARFNFLWK